MSALGSPLRDPQAVTIALLLLGLAALSTLLYGFVVPLFPPIVTQPVPLGAAALAAVGAAAAFGVWRREAWGRALAIGFAAVLLVRDVLFVVYGRPLELISIVLDVLLLFVLIRGRWINRT